MLPTNLLDVVPLWMVLGLSLIASLIAGEIGHQLGRVRQRAEHEREPTVGGIVAAELGLLAFLLAFTFSLAASRFEARREALLEEANAIGTTFLRAEMLPEPERTAIRNQLREYVDVRLTAVQKGDLESGVHRSTELQNEMWKGAVAVTKQDLHSTPRDCSSSRSTQSSTFMRVDCSWSSAAVFPRLSGWCSSALPCYRSVRWATRAASAELIARLSR